MVVSSSSSIPPSMARRKRRSNLSIVLHFIVVIALLWTTTTTTTHIIFVDGSSSSSRLQSSSNGAGITRVPSKLFSNTKEYWSKQFQSTWNHTISPLFPSSSTKPSSSSSSAEDEESKDAMTRLQNTIITSVSASKSSTLLPPHIVTQSAKRGGLLGHKLHNENVARTARLLKQWYTRHGYVLHGVTGATLTDTKGSVKLEVEEPKLNKENPVAIAFAQEMVVLPNNKDGVNQEMMPLREYNRKNKIHTKNNIDNKNKNITTTFQQTNGRIRPSAISKFLHLPPNEHFRFDADKFQTLERSKLFHRILHKDYTKLDDGSVQLRIIAESNPHTRNLQYSIGRGAFTGRWEGCLDFEHVNLFGGGEVGGITMRSEGNAEPSLRVRFGNDYFGSGGYCIEGFNEFIGCDNNENDDDDDAILRKGGSIRWMNPLGIAHKHKNGVTASFERTCTRTGNCENIGSATMAFGPNVKELARNGLHSLFTSWTAGTRFFANADASGGASDGGGGYSLLPYSSGSILARQIFPLSYLPSSSNTNNNNSKRRPITLALRHALSTSTRNLPKHEANALGFLAQVRGYKHESNGPIRGSIVGTAEIRVPIPLPQMLTDDIELTQDGKLVMFADWLLASRAAAQPPMHPEEGGSSVRKSSIGIGIRKSIRGINVKCDLCYTMDGKIGVVGNLGQDFGVA